MSDVTGAVVSDPALPAEVDVVIIGGGIVGSAAAYFLAKRGRSVAIVEKGRIGGEQSSRNWGFCRQQGRASAEIPLIKESLSLWEAISKETGRELGFRRAGILQVTDDPAVVARWQTWLNHAREHGIDSRLLASAEVKAITAGSQTTWLGGLHTPSDGRAEPGLATTEIASAARQLGTTILQSCAARGIDIQAGKVAGVVTERGRIRAPVALCAAGAWSSLFCRRHDVPLPQLMVRGSVLRTRPAPEVTNGAISSPGFSLRRRLDGGYTLALKGQIRFDITVDAFRYARAFMPIYWKDRGSLKIRFGSEFFKDFGTSRDWSLDSVSPFERNRVLDPEPDRGALDLALANLKRTYPSLAKIEVADTWAGMIDATPDAVPVISSVPSIPGFFLATGFSGHGFGIGPGAGRLAADLIAGDRPIVDPAPFRHARLFDGTKLVVEAGL